MHGVYQIFVAGLGIVAGAIFIGLVVRWFSPRPKSGDANRIVRWVLYNFASSLRRRPYQQLSRAQKALCYSALLLTGVGLVLILSPFARLLINLENYDRFEAPAGSEVYRAFGGLILMLVGRFLMNWAARGWGGVGIVPQPESTRTKLSVPANSNANPARNVPWDVQAVRQIENGLQTPEVSPRLHCRKCRAVNDQTAKLCARCGAAL